MRIDDKRFYPSNWQDFIHKGAITELFKAVPEINIPGLDASTIDKVEYQKDANNEYRMMVEYTDQDGVSHNTILNPAITQRVINLANQEVVKHFLYNQNGQDISIQTMKFVDDKLHLQLVDGQHIEIDLKPLIPRINVVGPDGEILQKDLNYQVADDAIVFVDLHGNETKLDFKKLVHVADYQKDQAAIAKKFTDFDTKKLDKDEFDQFNITNQAALDKKEDKTAHDNDQAELRNYVDDQLDKRVKSVDFNKFKQTTLDTLETKVNKNDMTSALDAKEDKSEHAADMTKLQTQINDRTTNAETDAALQKTVKQIKDWAGAIHDDLQKTLDLKVSTVIFKDLQKRVEDVNALKLSKTDYEHDKAGFATVEQLGDYVTNSKLTQGYYTKTDVDALLSTKLGQGALNDLQRLLQQQLDAKANASDVLADHYTKQEVDALIKTAQTSNRQFLMPYVADDNKWHVKLVELKPDGTVADVLNPEATSTDAAKQTGSADEKPSV
jgi:hypothetical protein